MLKMLGSSLKEQSSALEDEDKIFYGKQDDFSAFDEFLWASSQHAGCLIV